MRPVLLLFSSAALCLAQLQGIVDIHVHSDPDGVTRKLDALDTARLAKEAGVRAIVLKNHWAPTAQLAYTVAKVVPGIEVLGGIALDRAVGGVNPEAVKQGAAFTGGKLRIVWMPTFDAENYVRFSKQDLPFAAVSREWPVAAGNDRSAEADRQKQAGARRPATPQPPRTSCWCARERNKALRRSS